MTTIEDIYAGINPLPAMLTAKGRAQPNAELHIKANAELQIQMTWKKLFGEQDWEREYAFCNGKTFEDALAEAHKKIADLPHKTDAELSNFMGKLGRLIDQGKEVGIPVDYMNPLLDSMKRLSENAITYQPDDNIPF